MKCKTCREHENFHVPRKQFTFHGNLWQGTWKFPCTLQRNICLGKVHGNFTLRIDENAQPRVLPCRKIPLAIEDTVKKELDRLVEKDVLVPVTEPTEWVIQMAVVHKPNGKLRICIDPQPLRTFARNFSNIDFFSENFTIERS